MLAKVRDYHIVALIKVSLLICCHAFVPPKRFVVTLLHDPLPDFNWILHNASSVPQPGRRELDSAIQIVKMYEHSVVLEITASDYDIQHEEAMSALGLSSANATVEEDVVVKITSTILPTAFDPEESVTTDNLTAAEASILTMNGVEWYYDPSEPYGLAASALWNTTYSLNWSVAVVDSGVAHAALRQGLFRHIAPGGYDFVSSVLLSNDGHGRDNDPTDPGDGGL